MVKKLVVISGAGVSAESGIQTFRDSDGLWNNFNIEEVATYTAWENNPVFVQDFYNHRRRNILSAHPNPAHKAIVDLEKYFDVQIITQNIDDLHERAGSTKVLHLHGNIRYAKSSNPDLAWSGMSSTIKEEYYWLDDGEDLHYPDDKAPDGFPLRPHVVWFGESVPLLSDAAELVEAADIVIVVGTSLQVYPAASLIDSARPWVPIYYIDPRPADVFTPNEVNFIKQVASKGFEEIFDELVAFSRQPSK